VGRALDLSDEAYVDALTTEFAKNDYRLGGLIVGIVQSEPFQTK